MDKLNVQLVEMAQPCTACVIINSLNEETLAKLAAQRGDFTWEVRLVNHPRELREVDGLEVEELPAVLIDGEQVTAGKILPPRRLGDLLDERKTQGEELLQ